MKKLGYAIFIAKIVQSELDFDFDLLPEVEPEGPVSSLNSLERELIMMSGGSANARWNVKPPVSKLEKFNKERKFQQNYNKNKGQERTIDFEELSEFSRPDVESFINNELDRLSLTKENFIQVSDRSINKTDEIPDDREFYGQLRGCFYPDGITNRAIANGDCGFDTMETSPYFERAFTHCSGKPLANGTWYRALSPFAGKSNSLYFPIDLTEATGGTSGVKITDAMAICGDISPDYGQEVYVSCPASADENFYLWWHHPNQPFNYPATTGLWTGVIRDHDGSGYTDWTCAGLYNQQYFDWRIGEPSNRAFPPYEIYSYVRYTTVSWQDTHGAGFLGKAHFTCEMNCDYYDGPIYEEEEECCKNKYCEDFCVDCRCGCYGDGRFPHVNGSCIEPIQKYEIPCGEYPAAQRILEETLDKNDTQKVEVHGCHCVRLGFETQQLLNYLGGPHTMDELDNMCKSYFNARRCIYLNGGNCFGMQLSHEVNPPEYELVVNHENGTFSCDLVTETCMLDICKIDVEYVAQILGFFEALDIGEFEASVGDTETCPRCVGSGCMPPTVCLGEAPFLTPSKG